MVGQHLRNLGDSPDIFFPVGFRESKVLAKMGPDNVAVQHFHFYVPRRQFHLQISTDGGLAGAAQSGKPDR